MTRYKTDAPFIQETLSKLGIKRKFLNDEGIKKLTPIMIFNGEKLNISPSRTGTRQEYLLSALPFNFILEILVQQGKKQKASRLESKK